MLKIIARKIKRFFVANNLIKLSKKKPSLRWGVVGTGYMSNTWSELILLSGAGFLSSVCSRSNLKAHNFKKKYGFKSSYQKLDEMILNEKNNLDVIYVATPISSHYEIVKKCLNAQINVIVEKPATNNFNEWEELINLSLKNDVVLLEAMWMDYLPTFSKAQEWIYSNKIGKIQKLEVNFHKNIQADKGVLFDYGVYSLYFLIKFIGGHPDTFAGDCEYDRNGNDINWTIQATKNDINCEMRISSNTDALSKATIYGEFGKIEWDAPFNRTNKVNLCFENNKHALSEKFKYRFEGFEYQLEEFNKIISKRNLPVVREKQLLTLNTLKFGNELFNNIKPN